MTKQELAKKLDVSVTTITNWLTEGLPYTSKGSKGKGYLFDLEQVEEWIRQYKLPASTDDISFAEARRRRESALAGIKELELHYRQGKLWDSERVTEIYSRYLGAFRNRLLSFPAKLSPQLYGAKSIAEISTLLKKHVDQALNDLADLSFSDVMGKEKIGKQKPKKGGKK